MMMSELVFCIEILGINLFTLNFCCKKKYSYGVTLITFAGYSLVFFAFLFWAREQFFPGTGGNGSFAVAGLFYIIPLYILYQEKFFRLFVVMCMCWSYTFSVLVISIHLGKLICEENLENTALLIGSLLFLLTIVPFYLLVIPKFVFILKNIYKFTPNGWKYLALNGTIYFFGIMALNHIFNQGEASWQGVFVILLLTSFVFVFYITIYRMVYGAVRISEMEYEAGQDALTGISNRMRLFADLEKFLEEEKVFTVLFMDLDHFKQINDKYGHMTGDQYLKHFAEVCSSVVDERGVLYRFGGDEFVILYQGKVTREEIERLQECGQWEEGAPCPFYGVSVGELFCKPPHESANSILRQVDEEMYLQKVKQESLKES